MASDPRFGPRSHQPDPETPDSEPTPPVTNAEAWAHVRALTSGHEENFTVLSRLLPAEARDDFAAVYAFCRWADDLADDPADPESPDRSRQIALERLAWWRNELESLYAHRADPDERPAPTHPVYIALAETIARHAIPIEPFANLIAAFERDQTQSRYKSWKDLVSYCKGSADPVGRLVLTIAGVRPPHEDPTSQPLYNMSDVICTALQITNHLQDVRRDLFERDRVYLPTDLTGWTAEQLREWADRPNDPEVLVPYIKTIRTLINRTRVLYRRGRDLPARLGQPYGPVVALLPDDPKGGPGGGPTLWRRVTLSKREKAMLVLSTSIRTRLAGSSKPRSQPPRDAAKFSSDPEESPPPSTAA